MPNLLENAFAGVHFTRSLANFRLRKKARPMSAVFVVCNRCNLACQYCNSPLIREKELSLDEISLMLRNLRSMGVFRLGLTGGEPLLRNDLTDIILEANNLKFFVSLNSNLLLYNKRPEVFSGVRFVFTSLDGEKEVHEKNRGKKSYSGVLEAIRDLRARKIPVVAITVIDHHNVASIDWLIDTAEQIDFRLHFQIRGAAENPSKNFPIRGNFSQDFETEQYRSLWKHIRNRKEKSKAIASSRGYLDKIVNWPDYRQYAIKIAGMPCAAGYGYIFVASDGKGYPCGIIKDSTIGIDLLKDNWRQKFDAQKPCNDCICGPYLEMNLLYQKPLRSVMDLLSHYALQ